MTAKIFKLIGITILIKINARQLRRLGVVIASLLHDFSQQNLDTGSAQESTCNGVLFYSIPPENITKSSAICSAN